MPTEPTAAVQFRMELTELRRRAGYQTFAEISRGLDADAQVSADTVANIFYGDSLSKWRTIDAIIELMLVEARIEESEHRQIVERFRDLWTSARTTTAPARSVDQTEAVSPTTMLPELVGGLPDSLDVEDALTTTTVMYTADLVKLLDEEIGVDRVISQALAYGIALVVIKRGPHVGRVYLLDETQMDVGRHPASHIFLDDQTVSRRHSFFRQTEDERWTVTDAGSLNGTFVNRKTAARAPLKTGDEIQIGKFRLVFLESKVWAELSAGAKAHLVDLETPDGLDSPPGR